MKTTNQKTQLAIKIAFLKSKQGEEFSKLKNQYHLTIDSYKPFNLLKNSIQEAITSPNLKTNLISGTVGIGINYLSKKILNQNAINTKKTVFNKILNFVVTNFIGRR